MGHVITSLHVSCHQCHQIIFVVITNWIKYVKQLTQYLEQKYSLLLYGFNISNTINNIIIIHIWGIYKCIKVAPVLPCFQNMFIFNSALRYRATVYTLLKPECVSKKYILCVFHCLNC